MPFSSRLSMARDAGLELPEGSVTLWGATPESDLSALTQPQLISRDARVHARFPGTLEAPTEPSAASIVIVSREKKRARDHIAQAAANTQGLLIIDGQKTDGIEPLFKELKRRGAVAGPIAGPIAKAHGKLFWLETAPDLSDWRAQPLQVDGLHSMAGVFSADKVDTGSRLLAQALPAKLGASVLDLGAGWGWLSAQMVQDGREIHMVETDGVALDCARANVPGATAFWADVTTWQHRQLYDAVVMNPPFHEGRKGTPDLGQAFIAKAAQVLKPSGQLFMVANRHLPYEDTLAKLFAKTEEIGGDGRFKLFRATRPTRRRH
ncbi:class I SAM-dependent methyltransferase [Roseobacteraceae bacterium S113]